MKGENLQRDKTQATQVKTKGVVGTGLENSSQAQHSRLRESKVLSRPTL